MLRSPAAAWKDVKIRKVRGLQLWRVEGYFEGVFRTCEGATESAAWNQWVSGIQYQRLVTGKLSESLVQHLAENPNG